MNSPDNLTKTCFETLLAATVADNYEQFVSLGDERFRNSLKPEMFHRVSQNLAPRIQKGFVSTFLGELRQDGYLASVWRLRFDDGGDDLLFRMATNNGKVLGALVGRTF